VLETLEGLGRGNRALPHDARLRAREVDDRRGDAGQLAAVEDCGAAVADLLRNLVELPRVGAPAPTRSRTILALRTSSGTRTPIVSGLVPASQRKRCPGLGRISVKGPGRKARRARAGSSGTSSRSRSTLAAISAVGWFSSRPLRLYMARTGSGLCGAAARP
jgi:hypothetical protein